MATDRIGQAIAPGQVYGLAGTVRRVDGDSVVIVIGEEGFETVLRVKAADVVPVDAPMLADDWTGSLAGTGITTPQELADWIDANVITL
tara:strand:+ start:101 stop:367 length:267 start_codon:yes stop_codon:yes gene_type:complete